MIYFEDVPTMEELEEAAIRSALMKCSGNKTEAAKLLGISRRTIYRKVKKMEKENDPSLTSKDYQDAVNALSGSNLSGLAHSLARVVPKIMSITRSTAVTNRHPIVVLYVSQMAMLSGVAPIANTEVFNKAFEECVSKAEGL